MLLVILLLVCSQALPAQSATYYISPTGSDANPGTSAKPWLTFVYALDSSRASCGDTLVLLNGTYGDGTSTGKIAISGLTCTAGNELTIRALNQRQAKIFDNGTGFALRVRNSAYLIFDGLYNRSQDNSSGATGKLFQIETSNHITVRNSLARNPNRYNNAHTYTAYKSQDILFEDNESYVFSRHCVSAGESTRVVVRRQYCNPRGGKIPSGFSAGGQPLGSGDAVLSMYPCRDCIVENSIADGTESPMFLNEQNATYGSGVLQINGKVLGSICYKCNAGNAIYPNARKVVNTNYAPQNTLVRDVAVVDSGGPSLVVKCEGCINAVIEHVTAIQTGGTGGGIAAMDNSYGGTPAQNSITIRDNLVTGFNGTGFSVSGYNTWSGNNNRSTANSASFSPSRSSNWGSTYTNAHGMGTCKVWVPAGAAGKGQGTGGSDIGANILYRYVDGVLTTTPLWDPTTGEFPHGAIDMDGTNDVDGKSLKDIHLRLNVNTGGCSFPRNYGNGDSDTTLPAAPVGLRAS